MIRRYRVLIALFAIALQAMDGIIGAMGHSHGEKGVCCEAKPHDRHCGKCSHHRHDEAEDQSEHHSHPSRPQPDPHGDCTLCRHASQPVVVVTLTVEIVGCQFSEKIAAPLIGRIALAERPIHPARGPPAFVA